MAFDLKQYRKVHHTPHHSIFRHPDGHEIKVLHDKLDPKIKAEVMKLPKRNAAPVEGYADGGKVKPAPQAPQAPQGPQINPQDAANVRKAFVGYSNGTPKGPIPSAAAASTRYGVGAALPDTSPTFGPSDNLNLMPQQAPAPQSEPERVFNPAIGESLHKGFDTLTDAFKHGATDPLSYLSSKVADAGMTALTVPNPALPQSQGQMPEAPAPENVDLGGQGDPGAAPQGDIYGTNAYSQSYSQGVDEQKKGLLGEASALGTQGKAEAALIDDGMKKQADIQQHAEQHLAELEQERQAALNDFANGHIDPNRYMGSMDTSGKISTAIGLILGGMGGGLTGGGNPVLDFMNKQIDRDIQAQQANLNKKETILSANLKHFGNVRDSIEMSRVMMMDGVKLGLQKAAASAQDPMAKARALQAVGKIDADSAATLSSIASRQAIMSSGGAADPSVAIRMLIEPHQQGEAYKELKAAQSMGDQKKNLLGAFDQLQGMGSLGRTFSPHQAEALREPLLAQLVKDSEGRITPQDTEMIRTLFPKFGDSQQTTMLKRHQLDKFVSEKMHFPILESYGLAPKGKAAPAPNLNAPSKK